MSEGEVVLMILQPQEIPLSDRRSNNLFQPSPEKPFAATPAALETYGTARVVECLLRLQQAAARHNGLDYLQVFKPVPAGKREPLWFIEDGEGGAITALLPSDY